MALVVNSDLTGMQLAEKVAALAATKQHHLGKDMVNGTRSLTPAAFDGIMQYLARCADKEGTVTEPTGAQRYFEQRAAASPAYAEALDEAKTRLTFADIPAGFYATESKTSDVEGQCDFWKVTVSEKTGFRFVKRVLGGGTAQQPKLVEIPKQQQINALRAIIEAGIDASTALYAKKEQRCVKCGRQLTDEVSQEQMMGPDCFERYGE